MTKPKTPQKPTPKGKGPRKPGAKPGAKPKPRTKKAEEPKALPIVGTQGRIDPRVASVVRNAIAQAGGREVCFAAALDDDGVIQSVRVAARGAIDRVLALRGFAQRGEVLLHNHPSGDLSPSDADESVGLRLWEDGIGLAICNNDATALYVVLEPPPRYIALPEELSPGRPSLMTTDRVARILEKLEEGATLEVAAQAAGIGTSTLKAWRRRGRKETEGEYRNFLTLTSRAEARGELALLHDLRKTAGQREDLRASTQAAIFLLERRHPERWGKKDTIGLKNADKKRPLVFTLDVGSPIARNRPDETPTAAAEA